MKPTHTNPAYAVLAYRKAIVGEIIARLQHEYTSAMGEDPSKTIFAEEVPKIDSEVPEEEIGSYIEELQQEEESLRLELLKFDFVRRDEQEAKQVRKPQQPKAAAGKRVAATKGKPARKRKQPRNP